MLKGETSLNEICRYHRVCITDAYHWCALFLEGAKKAFEEGHGDKFISQEEIDKIKKIISEMSSRMDAELDCV